MRTKRNYRMERYHRATANRNAVLERLRSIHYYLRHSGGSFERELEENRIMREMPQYRKLRQYDHGYIDAVKDKLRDTLWNHETETAIWCRDRLYYGNETRELDGSGRWPEASYIGQVWKHDRLRWYSVNNNLQQMYAYPAVED